MRGVDRDTSVIWGMTRRGDVWRVGTEACNAIELMENLHCTCVGYGVISSARFSIKIVSKHTARHNDSPFITSVQFSGQLTTSEILTFGRLMSTIVDVPHC